jgi:dephospho-CoA kinase
MRRFYITGVSGVGKSSVAEKLKGRGISSIDLDEVDDLCNWVNKKTKKISNWRSGIGSDFLESHEYICDKEKLIALMNKYSDIIVVVGIVDNQSEIIDLFDKILLFHCDEEIFLKRIENRTNNDFGKHDSEKEMILGWYRDFEKEMIEKGAISINTKEPLDAIVDKVIKQIG